VELTATSSSGYAFDHWSGALTNSDNPAKIIMNANKEIIAHFVESTETISIPGTPKGSDNGVMGQSLSFSTGGASSNLGHEVEYRFDWGDGTLSNWGASTREHTYYSSGTMELKAQARCQTHTSIVSDWSDAHNVIITGYILTISIEPTETGSVAKNPDKTEFAEGDTVTLSASPITEYAFSHWSGNLSGNDNPAKIIMDGNKDVTANFAEILEIVSTPNTPNGPSNGFRGQLLSFSVNGSKSNLEHDVEYQFNWGDGNLSEWGDSIQSYIYYNSDIYSINARARCKIHTNIISDWSEQITIHISGCNLTISIEPENSGYVNKNPEKDDYDYGEEVTISPVANSGYKFGFWNGNMTDTTSKKIIIMDNDTALVANFQQITGVENSFEKLPKSFTVYQNYPNPFNPETVIEYQLPEDGHVSLQIYNLRGQKIRVLVDEQKKAGYHKICWDGKDTFGKEVSSGMYLYTIEVDDFRVTKKIVKMR